MFELAQVNLFVDDVEACVAFYTTHLGFTESFRTPREGTPEHVEVRLGGLILGIASSDAARRIIGIEVGEQPRSSVVVWTTGDVDEIHAALIAQGVTGHSDPADRGDNRGAWVLDPAGNPVEIIAKRV